MKKIALANANNPYYPADSKDHMPQFIMNKLISRHNIIDNAEHQSQKVVNAHHTMWEAINFISYKKPTINDL